MTRIPAKDLKPGDLVRVHSMECKVLAAEPAFDGRVRLTMECVAEWGGDPSDIGWVYTYSIGPNVMYMPGDGTTGSIPTVGEALADLLDNKEGSR